MASSRLQRWERRLTRVQDFLDRHQTRIVVALFALLGLMLWWDSRLVARDPDPWGDPTALVDLLGPWLPVTVALAIAAFRFELVCGAFVLLLELPLWLIRRRLKADDSRAVTAPGPDRRSALIRAGTVAGGVLIAVVIWLLPTPGRQSAGATATRAPAIDDTAAREQVHIVHALLGSPPIDEELRLHTASCNAPGSVSSDGWLVTRPGADPADRMAKLGTDLTARGWKVHHPNDRLLEASRDSYVVEVDIRHSPELVISVRATCHRLR
ncbi:hypothetical protein AB0J80_17895 [Actinoplanes sp. NPDC049548]|uniref:hypothetical protein n=1 Tax=Actinoplanes sp. NPDC049548 TaxID=3155152 RepID=UPI00344A2F31